MKTGPEAWWPTINDAESAKDAARSASHYILAIAAMVAIGAFGAITGKFGYANIKPWGFFQAAVLTAAAIGIARYYRGAAIFAMLFVAIELAWIGLERGVGRQIPMWLFIAVSMSTFITALRGTFGHHRYCADDAGGLTEDLVLVVSRAALLAIVVATLSFVGRNALYACFTYDTTPTACDRFGWGGNTPETRLRRATDAFRTWIDDDPQFKKWWHDNGNDGSKLPLLLRGGFRRLTYNELLQWNRLRVLISNTTDGACAGLWRGMDERILMNSLAVLPQADINAWFRLTFQTAKRQLPFGTDVPERWPEDEAVLRDGFKFIGDTQPSESARVAYRRFIDEGANISLDDACMALRMTADGVERMPWEQASRFMRAQLSPR